MKLSYAELLAKGKEALDALKLPFVAKKAHKDLEVKILDIEQAIAQAELTIQEQKSANPANWDKIIDAIDDKCLLDKRLAQLKELEEELFPQTK